VDFPTLIGHGPAAVPKQRPARRAVTEFHNASVIAKINANFDKRPMVALADIVGAAHKIAASALSGHRERLRAGTGGARAPQVMGRDDFRQT
jgi:hypothetical protein